jgi:hypothetical protein
MAEAKLVPRLASARITTKARSLHDVTRRSVGSRESRTWHERICENEPHNKGSNERNRIRRIYCLSHPKMIFFI